MGRTHGGGTGRLFDEPAPPSYPKAREGRYRRARIASTVEVRLAARDLRIRAGSVFARVAVKATACGWTPKNQRQADRRDCNQPVSHGRVRQGLHRRLVATGRDIADHGCALRRDVAFRARAVHVRRGGERLLAFARTAEKMQQDLITGAPTLENRRLDVEVPVQLAEEVAVSTLWDGFGDGVRVHRAEKVAVGGAHDAVAPRHRGGRAPDRRTGWRERGTCRGSSPARCAPDSRDEASPAWARARRACRGGSAPAVSGRPSGRPRRSSATSASRAWPLPSPGAVREAPAADRRGSRAGACGPIRRDRGGDASRDGRPRWSVSRRGTPLEAENIVRDLDAASSGLPDGALRGVAGSPRSEAREATRRPVRRTRADAASGGECERKRH